MAIINKEKYLKEIASLVHKDAILFDMEDRPGFEMGGRKVFVNSVSFDMDLGAMTYSICDAKGVILPSAKGVRPLSQLDIKTLGAVNRTVRQYADMRRSRQMNLENIKARVAGVERKNVRKPGSLSL